MDLPITRPSMICYADEIEFSKFLKDLSAKRHNGFIRITLGSDEGFILFKKGKEIAASYDRLTRVDAIEKIKEAMDDNSTILEIFDVRPSQIDFFMDMNKPYLIGSDAYDLIEELKKSKEVNIVPPTAPEPKPVPKPKPVSEAITKTESAEEVKPVKSESVEEVIPVKSESVEEVVPVKSESVEEVVPVKSESVEEVVPVKSESTGEEPISKPVLETVSPPVTDSNESENLKQREPNISEQAIITETEAETINEDVNELNTSKTLDKPVNEPVVQSVPEPERLDTIVEPSGSVSKNNTIIENSNSTLKSTESNQNESESIENAEMPPMDRSALMRKYGIKEIQEEDVVNLLESYKGGSVSDEDVEKIELTLMNKIKKSILAIGKIKGAEVMVFLDNTDGLSGKVNMIIESESKGFLSRLIGDSNNINLERQIKEISQIEIRKSFRKYPEIVEKFEVNVEIS